ncbi:MAG: hypothetical protein EZS28_020502 [Streblomastix strix]|uniref:KilA-N domain-containing protein n=1 Tax=Streblomastix strix TaxID=222440 RepID=A0A5J4VMX1_9EUKA|nr:MAG: hypothetical protein EZS28_020502 [Streblomastix strix]
MTSIIDTSTTQITSNDETFTKGSYNGFEIMIRDKDGYVNATKLVQQINEREHTTKELRNITRSPVFVEYKQYLQNISPFNLNGPLCYLLPIVFMNDVRGTYVHKQLMNIICMKTSVKYLHYVTMIMDSINERIQLTHQLDDTTSMAVQADVIFNQELEEKDTINKQLRQQIQDKDTTINTLHQRTVPLNHEHQYIMFLEQKLVEDNYITYKIQRQDKTHMKEKHLLRLQNESVLFFDNLPIAMSNCQDVVQSINQNFDTKVKNNTIRVLNTDKVRNTLFNFITQKVEQLRRQ